MELGNKEENNGKNLDEGVQSITQTASSSTSNGTTVAQNPVPVAIAQDLPKEAPPNISKKEKGLEDPVSFWASWSERQKQCEQNEHGTQTACNCFEGMGSVM